VAVDAHAFGETVEVDVNFIVPARLVQGITLGDSEPKPCLRAPA
jgi:hypothetical protein